jgi:5-methylcytosine-specific restriction endonuclease McrA
MNPFAQDALDAGRGFLSTLHPGKRKPSARLRIRHFYQSRAWRALRYRVLVKRGGRCECCGRSASDGVRIVVDHIVPVKKCWDRRLDETNLQVLCNDCNLAKSSQDATDWRAASLQNGRQPSPHRARTR